MTCELSVFGFQLQQSVNLSVDRQFLSGWTRPNTPLVYHICHVSVWDIRGNTPFCVKYICCQCCDVTYQKNFITSWCLDIRRNTPSRHWFLISRPRMKDETVCQCLCLVRVMQIVTASAKKTLKPKRRIENASVCNHWEHTPHSYFPWFIPLHSTEISNICWIILTKVKLWTHLVSISR